MSDQPQQPMPTVGITAFAVILTEDGRWIASADVKSASEVSCRRNAELSDFITGAQSVAMDASFIRTLSETTRQVLQAFNHAGMEAQRRQMEEQAISQVLTDPYGKNLKQS